MTVMAAWSFRVAASQLVERHVACAQATSGAHLGGKTRPCRHVRYAIGRYAWLGCASRRENGGTATAGSRFAAGKEK